MPRTCTDLLTWSCDSAAGLLVCCESLELAPVSGRRECPFLPSARLIVNRPAPSWQKQETRGEREATSVAVRSVAPVDQAGIAVHRSVRHLVRVVCIGFALWHTVERSKRGGCRTMERRCSGVSR
jgi:hypothetical protein